MAVEETRFYEFKEVKGNNPVDAIKNTADEYVVAILMGGERGHILWGVRDSDRVVVGVRLNAEQRNRLRREVICKLHEIKPPLDPGAYRLTLHPVRDAEAIVPDLFVVEITVPLVFSKDPLFTGGNETFIKTDSGKKKLSGPELVEWIKRRTAERYSSDCN